MANMIPISTVTVGSTSVASIDFTGIPQTYTDLMIVLSSRADANPYSTNYADVRIRFNSNTSSYTWRNVATENGSTAVSGTDTKIVAQMPSSAATSSTFGSVSLYIPNYTSSNNKSISINSVTENNATGANLTMAAGLWSNTSPISEVNLIGISANFVQYSSATLYGIRKY
jgi:hypothetical protein